MYCISFIHTLMAHNFQGVRGTPVSLETLQTWLEHKVTGFHPRAPINLLSIDNFTGALRSWNIDLGQTSTIRSSEELSL